MTVGAGLWWSNEDSFCEGLCKRDNSGIYEAKVCSFLLVKYNCEKKLVVL